MKHWYVAMSVAIASGGGCTLEQDDVEGPTVDEDAEVGDRAANELENAQEPTSVAEAYGYWIFLEKYNPYASIYWRACKTATRVNWQFAGNSSFNKVSTYGSAIGWLTSDIGGQSSGTKYRTRNNTSTFVVLFQGLAGQLWNEHSIWNIPDC